MIIYLQRPVDDLGGIGNCLIYVEPVKIGWPQTAIKAVLENPCGNGAWVEVNFPWLGIELGAVLLVICGIVLGLNAYARAKNSHATKHF